MIYLCRFIIILLTLSASAAVHLIPAEAALAMVALFMPVFSTACTCAAWTDHQTVPCSWQVDVAGLTDGTCTGCAAANVSYVLDSYPVLPGCRWCNTTAFASPICTNVYFASLIASHVVGQWRLFFAINGDVSSCTTSASKVGAWTADVADSNPAPDLTTYSAFSIPNFNAFAAVCTCSGCTCAATAL